MLPLAYLSSRYKIIINFYHYTTSIIYILLFKVRATDDDVGIFGEVEYSFQETVLDFNISVTNGHVVTAKELDYEMQSQYVLSIMANDLHPTLSR